MFVVIVAFLLVVVVYCCLSLPWLFAFEGGFLNNFGFMNFTCRYFNSSKDLVVSCELLSHLEINTSPIIFHGGVLSNPRTPLGVLEWASLR